jgi:Cu(I)/Ag(I) efflux system membrane fusion protein
MKKMLSTFTAVLLALAAGVALERQLHLSQRLAAWSGAPSPSTDGGPAGPAADANKARKILYWVAPMDPNYRRDKPGKSPMGMDLIPVYEGEEPERKPGAPATVSVSPEVANSLGVRTSEVRRKDLSRRIETVGFVSFDEGRISHIHPRTEGWIERLLVKSEGERVKKGDLLFELYSPVLVNAQHEYVQALSTGSQSLAEASAQRLRSLGVAEGEIQQLARTRKVQQRVQTYAPQDGVVAALNVRQGMYIMPSTEVMSLADLGTVWVFAEVFERQTDWVEVGQPAEIRLPYRPGSTWQGRVEYVYPDLDPKTRTLRVRLRFENPRETLKPNMYAAVTLRAGEQRAAVVVPRGAVIRTGQGDRVVLALGGGRFQPREVVTGVEGADEVEILEGLEPGERVVVSAQFLIDSESSLKASFARIAPPAEHGPHGQAISKPAVAEGVGVVMALVPESRKLNIEHDPIPRLGWPAMTMDFEVADQVPIGGLHVGSRVRFQLGKTADSRYLITAIEPLNHPSP